MATIAEFADFARKEISHGGPEPELSPIVWLTRNATPLEKVWAAGVYCTHHCVPSAMIVYREWPLVKILEATTDEVESWFRDHWNALPVRTEMRSHRIVEKRVRCLRDFAFYTVEGSWPLHYKSYDDIWDECISKVKYFGRYVAIKYMEFLRRMVRPDLVLPDVRIASGAWSVREGLAHLYPETRGWMADREDNSSSTIEAAELIRHALQVLLATEQKLVLSNFDIQVLLCEFKQWTNGTFYPGVSHDEEMMFGRQVETQFSIPEFWEARRVLFPHDALGELNGWEGKRKDQYRGKTATS